MCRTISRISLSRSLSAEAGLCSPFRYARSCDRSNRAFSKKISAMLHPRENMSCPSHHKHTPVKTQMNIPYAIRTSLRAKSVLIQCQDSWGFAPCFGREAGLDLGCDEQRTHRTALAPRSSGAVHQYQRRKRSLPANRAGDGHEPLWYPAQLLTRICITGKELKPYRIVCWQVRRLVRCKIREKQPIP